MVDDDGSEGLKRLYISVGIDGPLGPIDLESEWTYQDTKYEDLSPVAEDATALGAYVNLSKTMDFGKAGIVLMYASGMTRVERTEPAAVSIPGRTSRQT